MGYVDRRHTAEGTALALLVRGVARPARVARLPFVPHRYRRPHPNPPLPGLDPGIAGEGREGAA